MRGKRGIVKSGKRGRFMVGRWGGLWVGKGGGYGEKSRFWVGKEEGAKGEGYDEKSGSSGRVKGGKRGRVVMG